MYTLTFITSPDTPKLTEEYLSPFLEAWNGSDLTWLAQGQAAECDVPQRPANFEAIWAELQRDHIDMVCQESAPSGVGRKKAVLLADMDSTMIEQECIDELAAHAGLGEQVSQITAQAMNGALDFEAALEERVALLKGLACDAVTTVLAERITYMPGGKTLLATMTANGAYAALVSGGFTVFSSEVAKHLGFHEHRANVLLAENGLFTGRVSYPILGRDAKVNALNEITATRDLTPADVLAVGDGANDLGMLSRAGTGVALHAKPSVQQACDVRVNHGDLTALLYIQGYSQSDFVV